MYKHETFYVKFSTGNYCLSTHINSKLLIIMTDYFNNEISLASTGEVISMISAVYQIF